MIRSKGIRFSRLLIVTALVALVLGPPASGQSLKKLWSEYPLYQGRTASNSAEPARGQAPAGLVPAQAIGAASVQAVDLPSSLHDSLPNNRESLQWLFVLAFAAATLGIVLVAFLHLHPLPALSLAPARAAATRVAAFAASLPGELNKSRSSGRARGGERGGPRRARPPRARAAPSTPQPRAQAPSALAEATVVPSVDGPVKPAEPEEETRELEYCTVECWRGYVKSQFFARALRPDGRSYIAARSPFFRSWHSGEPEESEQARGAHGQLLLFLRSTGWEHRAGECDWAWYSACFAREPTETLEQLRDRLEREGEG